MSARSTSPIPKSHAKTFRSAASFKSSLITTLALRILRRWNQTGQKYAGSPDIAHTFLLQHPTILFILVLLTYLHTARQLELSTLRPVGVSKSFSRVVAYTLSLTGFAFKIRFTLQDSPELFSSFPAPLLQVARLPNLVLLARLVFTFTGLLSAYVVSKKLLQKSNGCSCTQINIHPAI